MLIRSNRRFTRLTFAKQVEFLRKTTDGFEAAVALKPPTSSADLRALADKLEKANMKADKGGVAATAARKAVSEEAIVALTNNASYLDTMVNGSVALILEIGYEPVSTNRAQAPLAPPTIIAVVQQSSGVLKARVKADRNTRSFLGRIKEAEGGEFGPVISFESSRKILFGGLKAGILYIFQLCAIGGSTGKSDWSEPVTKMAV